MSSIPAKPPIAAADIPPEWTDMLRNIIQRDGYAVRGPADPVIELKSLHTNEWQPIMLYGSGTTFVNTEERDTVLRLLHGRNP